MTAEAVPASCGSPAERSSERALIRRRAVSIAMSTAPFGVAFGASCAEAGLGWTEALGFSTLVFTGAAQFAAVRVLADGGAAAAAIATAVLLSLRCLAYGVVMAPALTGPRWWRALASHLMIDESMAMGTAVEDPAARRYGYLWGGLSVFVIWNTATLAGVLAAAGSGDAVERLGLDATIPAAFLALVWPRLADPRQRAVAIAGAAIAIVAVPLAPAGVPILLAGLAAFAVPAIDRRRTPT
jgi:predicted branched-subunit amino acid permease